MKEIKHFTLTVLKPGGILEFLDGGQKHEGIEDEKSKESIQCFSMFSADAGPIGVGGLCLGGYIPRNRYN